MFAVASGQGHNPTDEILQASFAVAAPRQSVGAAIRHGMAIGVAATVLQILLLLALLYACGVIAS